MLQFGDVEWQIVQKDRDRFVTAWNQAVSVPANRRDGDDGRRWPWRARQRARIDVVTYVRNEWMRPFVRSGNAWDGERMVTGN